MIRNLVSELRDMGINLVSFFGFFSATSVSNTTKQIERMVAHMTSQDYMIRENIELTNIAGSNLVIGKRLNLG